MINRSCTREVLSATFKEHRTILIEMCTVCYIVLKQKIEFCYKSLCTVLSLALQQTVASYQ